MATTPDVPTVRIAGYTLALFAFDIGFQIDLDAAGKLESDATRRRVVRARRPAPVWFDYSPPPLRLVDEGEPVDLDGLQAEPNVEMLVYDFGAALLTYRLPLPATLDELPSLSMKLYAHRALEADARARVQRVIDAIRPAIERPRLSDAVEDYVVFAINTWDGGAPPSEILELHRGLLARAVEAETHALAEEQASRATEGRISYTPTDLAIIDWNTAVLFDHAPEDVIAVIQHANVELLELRVLDQELDRILDNADTTLSTLIHRRIWPGFASGRMLRRIASAQTDAAVMFEGVNNAIKLMGNQYLARLYRLAAGRLDLPAWEKSVQRKLEVMESLYQKMSDASATRRLETLEWVVIALIAVSIILSFTPWYAH